MARWRGYAPALRVSAPVAAQKSEHSKSEASRLAVRSRAAPQQLCRRRQVARQPVPPKGVPGKPAAPPLRPVVAQAPRPALRFELPMRGERAQVRRRAAPWARWRQPQRPVASSPLGPQLSESTRTAAIGSIPLEASARRRDRPCGSSTRQQSPRSGKQPPSAVAPREHPARPEVQVAATARASQRCAARRTDRSLPLPSRAGARARASEAVVQTAGFFRLWSGYQARTRPRRSPPFELP